MDEKATFGVVFHLLFFLTYFSMSADEVPHAEFEKTNGVARLGFGRSAPKTMPQISGVYRRSAKTQTYKESKFEIDSSQIATCIVPQ